MDIYVENEYDRLTDVVVGNSFNFKTQINFRDLYDPISLFHYLKGSFPNKSCMDRGVLDYYFSTPNFFQLATNISATR